MFNVEDDDDFTPVASSKLARLFGQSSDPGNKSLVYTAPKQPKKGNAGTTEPASSQRAAQAPKLDLVVMKGVQTFKLEAGNYNAQGRLGAAVLGCPITRVFQLLLYRSNEQRITNTKITDSFKFTVQRNNYASFYDDQRQNWSILFGSEPDAIEFAREVGIACASAYRDEDPQPFYIQDLKLGDGVPAELGNHVDIRYTVSSFLNCSIGQELDNNLKDEEPRRVKVCKDCWKEALLDVTKGGKRLIILGPALFGPWKRVAPANSRLAVEVEVVRVNNGKKSREPTPTILKQFPPESSESNVDSSTDEMGTIKARGASISEALKNSPKTQKANIISRMARMGQATLPLKGAVVCNPSDSEETEEESAAVSGGSSSTSSKPTIKVRSTMSSAPSKPTVKARSTTSKTRSSRQASGVPQEPSAVPMSVSTAASTPVTQQLTLFSSVGPPWQQAQSAPHLVNGVPYTVPSQYNISQVDGTLYPAVPQHQLFPSSSAVGTPPESHMAVFMSENRAQNTELRMGITKIVDKVDQVIAKVDGLQQQRTLAPSSIGGMEPTVLLASIQKLVTEHELLQAELADKRAKLEQQNEKMFHLLHVNQKFMEQQNSSMMEQRHDSALQAMILGLQQEKEKLVTDLRDAESEIRSLQEEAGRSRKNQCELSEEVNSLTCETHRYQEELKNCQASILELEKKLLKSEEELKTAKLTEKLQESTIEELKASKTLLEENIHEQWDQKSKKTDEQLAAYKEEVRKLEAQLRLRSDSGDNAELEKQAQEITDKYRKTIDDLQKDKAVLQDKVMQLEGQLRTSSVPNPTSSSDVVEGVKKIMNVLFRLLTSKFTPEGSYEGAKIQEVLLTSIKDVTLQYLNLKQGSETQPSQEVVNSTEKKLPKAGETKDKPLPAEVVTSRAKDEQNHPSSVEENQVHAEETKDKPQNNSLTPSAGLSSDVSISKIPDAKPPEPQTNLLMTPASELTVRQSRDSSLERGWRPQPPPSPLFDEEDDDDDWLS